MIKYITVILLLLTSNSAFSQLSDLCGVWLGYNYQCYTILPDSSLNFYTKTEVILIEHNGDSTVATKIIGDDCVTDGQITWQGNYNQNPFSASVTLGSPSSSGISSTEGMITVVNPNRIQSSFGVTFVKAKCSQIDSLNLNLDSLNLECNYCQTDATIVMPNVFTPNSDGVNDLFAPIVYNGITKSSIKIFNRWGNLVYTSNDLNLGWNGKTKSNDCSEGVYFWIINYDGENSKKTSIKGAVTLLR